MVEAVDEFLDRFVYEGVVGDFVFPHRQLRGCRQLPGEQEVGDFKKAAPFRQFGDRESAVAQDAGIPVDEGDGAATTCCVGESRVVGHQTEVAFVNLYRPQGAGPDRAVGNRDLIGLTGAVISDGQGADLLGHAGLLSL